MIVVVALRTSNASQARQFLAEQGCDIHKSRFETQEPALRNLIDGLYQQGLDIELQGASLSWFLLEASFTPKQWLEQSSVAMCFSFDWFQQQAAQIRHLKGIAYCDAAAAWAKLLPINDRAASEVQAEGLYDWQGLQNGSLASTAILPKAAAVNKPMARQVTEQAPDALEDSFANDSCRPVDGAEASLAEDCVPAELSSQAQTKPKKSSARKIITKILSATKNIAQTKPKADASLAQENSSVVKADAVVHTAQAPAPAIDVDQPVVKKRGRPRKNPVVNIEVPSALVSSGGVAECADAKPVLAVEAEPAAPKKRGRPRKVVAAVTPELDEEQLDLFVS